MKNKQYVHLILATFFCTTLVYVSLIALITLKDINPIFDFKFNGIEYPDTELAKLIKNADNNKRDPKRE